MQKIIFCLAYCILGVLGTLYSSAFVFAQQNSSSLQCPAQPGLGPACAAADSPWLLPLAGNPINILNGNKYTLHEDIPALAGAPLLFIQRHYNAQSMHHSILGRNWSLNWDIRLQPSRQHLLLADGRQWDLKPQQMRPVQMPEVGYEVLFDAQNTLRFNAAGYLIEWHKAPQGVLRLHRYPADHPTLAHEIKTLYFGTQKLELHYKTPFEHHLQSKPLLQAIKGPFGHIKYDYEWVFSQQQARLIAVRFPDGRQQLYHYEHPKWPFALTGMSWQFNPQQKTPLRMHYWWYDTQGRAIFSARANGQRWIRIDYAPQDQNLNKNEVAITPNTHSDTAMQLRRSVHSAQGQSDFFFVQHKGQWRLSHSSGPQCSGCPPTGLFWQEHDEGVFLKWPGAEWQHHDDGRRTLKFTTPNTSPSMPQSSRFATPDLKLDFDSDGRLIAWQQPLTGKTQLESTSNKSKLHIKYANGDEAILQRDKQGRPLSVRFLRGYGQPLPSQDLGLAAPITVLFDGLGSQRLSFHHPNESQWWVLDAQQRLRQRSVHRQISTSAGSLHWTFEDRFDYDAAGLLSTHHLFEGGSLHYEYDAQQRLKTIIWQPAQGPKQTVLHLHDDYLWEHHNGIFDFYGLEGINEHLLVFNKDQLFSWHIQELQPAPHTTAPTTSYTTTDTTDMPQILAQHAWWDWPQTTTTNTTNTTTTTNTTNTRNTTATTHSQYYLHDAMGRLVGARSADTDWQYWAWNSLGQNITTENAIDHQNRDPSGLLHLWQGKTLAGEQTKRRLFYNAQRRLAAVLQDEVLMARYDHDAFGQRVYAYYPQQKTNKHRLFIFHQHQLVAEWYGSHEELHSFTGALQPHPIKRRYIYLGDQPVALIDYSATQPRLYAIHSQFIGAPIAVSDDQQRLVWQAQYHPLGGAEVLLTDFYLPLRLPGHYADPVTGWHDNGLRTYDPHQGHYLNPDPLGPAPAQQLLGYARQRPWQLIDPLGLLLFAFDGTRYDARLNSNVWKFANLYADTAYYQSGPGNASYVDWDAITAWRAHQIVQNQWQHLLNEIIWSDPGERLAIDIIGFSRGAALARHFGNELLQYTQQGWFHYEDDFGRQYAACLEPRFLGLFDTVAQFGLLGSHNRLYDLSVAPEWAWVAHAVALNEHRQLFPLYSIEDDPDTALPEHRIQAGFIGAHADIGGGQDGQRQGDLAHIPLAWMIWQAQSLGLAFAQDEVEALQEIQEPVLHDDRAPYWRFLNTDRQVQIADHSKHQWLHPHIGQAVRAQVEAFIDRFDGWQSKASNAVGRVDLDAYYQWLEQKLHWRPIPAVN